MADDYNNHITVKINSVADGSCVSWTKRIQVPPSTSMPWVILFVSFETTLGFCLFVGLSFKVLIIIIVTRLLFF